MNKYFFFFSKGIFFTETLSLTQKAYLLLCYFVITIIVCSCNSNISIDSCEYNYNVELDKVVYDFVDTPPDCTLSNDKTIGSILLDGIDGISNSYPNGYGYSGFISVIIDTNGRALMVEILDREKAQFSRIDSLIIENAKKTDCWIPGKCHGTLVVSRYSFPIHVSIY